MTEPVYGSTIDADDDEHQAYSAKAPRPTVQSPLDELREAAAEDISNVTYFDIENRKGGWIARFDAVISADEVKRWQRRAQGKKKRPEDADTTLAAGQGLVEKNTGLYRGGTTHEDNLVLDADGDPLTFGSTEFLSLYPDLRNDSIAVLRRFLGDAQLLKMGSALMTAAGYDEDMQPVDPTSD